MESLSTIVIATIIAVAFVAIIINEIKKRKNGSGCSCGCSSCGMSEICHGKKTDE